jgi:hypothetical protein
MKKKLLKPPSQDGEILILPSLKEILSYLKKDSLVGVAHQPYFFNPGVSLKFIFLHDLNLGKKKIIFVDTDKIKLEVKLPYLERKMTFLDTEEVLFNYFTPQEKEFKNFFLEIENKLKKDSSLKEVLSNFLNFKEILFDNLKKKFLKEVLGETFLKFYKINQEWCFLTDLFDKSFYDFFFKIYQESDYFRDVFNNTLDDYKKNFKFRFKNFPFPKLEKEGLPFWILKENKRIRFFKKDYKREEAKKLKIFPRAITLTIFLRLYKLDFFIHGVGGANYEWVTDRIIERFFKKSPPSYAVVSGTFLLKNSKEREFPYFFFNPLKIKEKLRIFKKKNF